MQTKTVWNKQTQMAVEIRDDWTCKVAVLVLLAPTVEYE